MRYIIGLLLALACGSAFADGGGTTNSIAPSQVGPGLRLSHGTVSTSLPAYATGDALLADGVTPNTIAANTQLGPAQVYTAASGSALLQFAATYNFRNVTLVCSSGNPALSLTLPAGVTLPANLSNATGIKYLLVAACGYANPLINSVSGSGQSWTLNMNQNPPTPGTYTSFALQEWVTACNGTNPVSCNAYHHYLLEQCTITAGSKTLACPVNTFNTATDITQFGSDGDRQSSILIQDSRGTCADFATQIVTNDGANATLATPAPCTIPSLTNLQIWWGSGSFLFAPGMVGQYVDVPGAGTASTLSGMPSASWLSAIASYTNPFNVTLSTNSGTALSPILSRRVAAFTDDSAALTALAQAAVKANTRWIYFTPGTVGGVPAGGKSGLIGVAAPNQTWLGGLVFCNDGHAGGNIYYPEGWHYSHRAAGCMQPAPMPVLDATLSAENFAHSRTVKGTLHVAIVGDSTGQWTAPNLGMSGYLPDLIARAIGAMQSAVTDVEIFNWSVGSTNSSVLDPYGPSVGNGAGIPSNTQISPVNWYTNNAKQWWLYVRNEAVACPDVVFESFANTQYGQRFSSEIDNWQYTQQAAWQTACGFTPDFIVVIPPLVTTAPTLCNTSLSCQGGVDYANGWLRTFLRTKDPLLNLATGGKVGFIDLSQPASVAIQGYDPSNLPMTRSMELVGSGVGVGGNTSIGLPFVWPRAVRNVEIQAALKQNGTSSPSTWWTATGKLCISTGSGDYGAPYAVTGSNLGLTIGYPGERFCVSLDSGSGNLQVEGYSFDFTSTATVTSGVAASTTVVFSTAVANTGHGSPLALANLTFSGGGLGSPWSTTGYFSSDGKTVTTTGAVPAGGITGSTTIRVYHQYLPTVVTDLSGSQLFGGSNQLQLGIRVDGGQLLIAYGNSNNPQQALNYRVAGHGGEFSPILSQVGGSQGPILIFLKDGSSLPMSAAGDVWSSRFAESRTAWECWGWPSQDPTTANGYDGPYGGGYSAHWGKGCSDIIMSALRASMPPTLASPNAPGGRLTLQAAVANGGYVTIPPGAIIRSVVLDETANNAVSITLGTTSGASDVAGATSLGALGRAVITSLSQQYFSATTTQKLYVSSTSWSGSSVNMRVLYDQ